MTNAEGFTYQNNIITIDHASSITIDDTWSFNVDDAVIDTETYHIGSADKVTVGDITFNNVQNSTFSLIPNGVIVYPEEALNIIDSNDAELTFQPNENSAISIKETMPAIYQISNGTLSFKNESFSSDNTATIDINPFTGFGCIYIKPSGTYYKYDDDIRKNFAVRVYQEPYTLCFSKPGQPNPSPTEDNYGVIDFIENKVFLNGLAQYRRYIFNDYGIIGTETKNVYDGHEPDVKAQIILGNGRLYVDDMILKYSRSSPLAAIVNPTEYLALYEGDNSLMDLSNQNKANNIIQEYQYLR